MEFNLYLLSASSLSSDKQNALLEDIKKRTSNQGQQLLSTTSEVRYENPVTGVYFHVFYAALGQNSVSGMNMVPDDYYDTGIAVKIPYFKGAFFAAEVLLHIGELCSAYELLVMDPQQATEDNVPQPEAFDRDTLLDSYKFVNRRVASELIKKEAFQKIYHYLDEAASMEWWSFMFKKEQLEHHFQSLGIFVPRLMLVHMPPSTQVYRAFILKSGLTTLIPPADKAVIMNEGGDGRVLQTSMLDDSEAESSEIMAFKGRDYCVLKFNDFDELSVKGERFSEYASLPPSAVLTDRLKV